MKHVPLICIALLLSVIPNVLCMRHSSNQHRIIYKHSPGIFSRQLSPGRTTLYIQKQYTKKNNETMTIKIPKNLRKKDDSRNKTVRKTS